MQLLFKREQKAGRMSRVNFKLWAKVDLDDEEQALVKRYKFDRSVLFEETDNNLMRKAGALGVLAGVVAYLIADLLFPMQLALIVALGGIVGAAYSFYNEKRERLLVRDLLHGRNFTCPGIIELVKKEAEIANVSALLRQVMESAKHWGGTDSQEIPAMSKEEARDLILRAF